MTNDLISRKAAMKFTTPEDWGTPDERWRPESEYGKFIESLPPADQWIPCSERLPKEKKTYWVCTDTGYQCECRFTDNVYGLGVGALGWKVFDIPRFSRVIAWMELPEPYKEEE